MTLEAAMSVGTFLATEHRPGIPGAPVDSAVDASMEATFTAVCAFPTAFVLLVAVRGLVKHRNAVLPVFLIGGVLGMFVEPILDYMGGVWWPLHGGWDAFTLLGVNIPWLVVMVYPWLLGGQGYLAYRQFEKGITTRRLWQLIGLFAATDIVLETIGITVLNVYSYFGTQPLNFWGLPLWYVPCNAIGPVLAGALTYVLRRRLTGIKMLAAAPLFPISFLGTYAAIGYPVWISLNSGWSYAAATLAGLATFAAVPLLVAVIAEITGARPAGAGTRGSADSDAKPHVGVSSG